MSIVKKLGNNTKKILWLLLLACFAGNANALAPSVRSQIVELTKQNVLTIQTMVELVKIAENVKSSKAREEAYNEFVNKAQGQKLRDLMSTLVETISNAQTQNDVKSCAMKSLRSIIYSKPNVDGREQILYHASLHFGNMISTQNTFEYVFDPNAGHGKLQHTVLKSLDARTIFSNLFDVDYMQHCEYTIGNQRIVIRAPLKNILSACTGCTILEFSRTQDMRNIDNAKGYEVICYINMDRNWNIVAPTQNDDIYSGISGSLYIQKRR